ncbi:thioredoxin family protein [Nonlabens marinus]|uniref:Thioredoxin n=1 Tax=Nonlabens marinus S1-08 TaxID=1454201 RepID=W8VWF1_9FLAO|nr:thioredoxin family protein [Nonlabens marinus]BAO54682.1 thioredoxin [Nonlabens marinus S1-08]
MELNDTIEAALENSMSYLQYRTFVESHAINHTNSGDEQTPALAQYTALNHQRMKRQDKVMRLKEESLNFLASLQRKLIFLCITETWCGDAAQTMPMINKIAVAGGVEFRIVLRDENLDLMDRFLTNGARSVAKVILLDAETHEAVASWGPRPTAATPLVAEEKRAKGALSPEFKQQLQTWYNKDKGEETERDIITLLKQL